MARILVVEDSRTQAQQVRLQLEDRGHDVELAGDGVFALTALRRLVPDLVLTDLDMPNMNGLALVEAVRREFAHVPVVLMTAHGSEEIAAMTLSKGAASYIPKAYLEDELAPTVKRILALTQANRQHVHAFDCLTGTELHYTLRNDPALIGPIVGYVDGLLQLAKLCDATARMRVGVALQEALLNAIFHGNLELGTAVKRDEAAFANLVKVRAEQPPYQGRRVFLDVSITPLEATFRVRDEGPGFDPQTLPDPGDATRLGEAGGRGYWLMRTFMDSVSHNTTGNIVTLTKRRDA